jgi:hypothetical protein
VFGPARYVFLAAPVHQLGPPYGPTASAWSCRVRPRRGCSYAARTSLRHGSPRVERGVLAPSID